MEFKNCQKKGVAPELPNAFSCGKKQPLVNKRKQEVAEMRQLLESGEYSVIIDMARKDRNAVSSLSEFLIGGDAGASKQAARILGDVPSFGIKIGVAVRNLARCVSAGGELAEIAAYTLACAADKGTDIRLALPAVISKLSDENVDLRRKCIYVLLAFGRVAERRDADVLLTAVPGLAGCLRQDGFRAVMEYSAATLRRFAERGFDISGATAALAERLNSISRESSVHDDMSEALKCALRVRESYGAAMDALEARIASTVAAECQDAVSVLELALGEGVDISPAFHSIVMCLLLPQEEIVSIVEAMFSKNISRFSFDALGKAAAAIDAAVGSDTLRLEAEKNSVRFHESGAALNRLAKMVDRCMRILEEAA
jgi:hypothetical protein